MFRVVGLAKNLLQNANIVVAASNFPAVSRSFSSGKEMSKVDDQRVVDKFSNATLGHKEETPEEFDQRFLDEFNRPDIDGWYVRRAMTALQHADVVPEPNIVAAALRACRKVDDYALAIRFMESIKLKCGAHAKQIYPYIIQEVKPVLDELGISTPEEMGYDQPEFHIPSPDWWPKEYYQLYNIRERTPEEILGPPYYAYEEPSH